MFEVEQIQTGLVILFASIIFFYLGQQWSNTNQYPQYDSLRSDDESQNYESQIQEFKKKMDDQDKKIQELTKQLENEKKKNQQTGQ